MRASRQLLAGLLLTASSFGESTQESIRVTDTVRVVQKTERAVAAIFSQSEGELSMGSGSVIHPSGYILTNDHVIANKEGLVLLKGHKPLPYKIVGNLPEKDLCLIKVSHPEALAHIRLGHSNDLMTGEPILCAGNPGGRGIVFSRGIVSSPNFILNAPNALTMYYFNNDVRDRFIQFDAASNRGNSGGPLINILGQQVGVVAAKNPDEENINFAIPINRVKQNLAELFNPEIRKGFYSGITIDLLSDKARVVQVASDSPAEQAGIRTDDIILRLGKKSLKGPIDWMVELLEHDASTPLDLKIRRGEKIEKVDLKLSPYPTPETVDLEKPKEGLLFKVCFGKFERTPDFSKQKIVKTGVAWKLDVPAMGKPRKDNFAVQLEGYIKIPKDGIYRLILNSDDGSRLNLAGKNVIDNDGPHPAQDMSRMLRLSKGFIPIQIDYFEATGDSALSLYIEESPDKRTSAENIFYHEAPAEKDLNQK